MATEAAAVPQLKRASNSLAAIFKFADLGLALGVVGVIVILVIPIPTSMLDILLCLQFALSLAVLLGTMYCNEPLEFSGFPSMLLFVTLFRLALNVASSRLILLNGDAGTIIQSFGNFVVGGNYVVGAAIFLVLVAIQFVVITKGAGRVAEVAARFTLDAMPGKQMAIDADLNAGLIDETQARTRREKIEREASFFGSMDGASKFVRGDAIAALLITAINLLGGLAIGVLQRDMAIGEALQRYSLLTIGDGLVSQIPALLISTASGVLVTRSASDVNLGQDLSHQLLLKSRPLMICSGFLALFALMPGLPGWPFALLALSMFMLARMLGKTDTKSLLPGYEKNKAAEKAAEEAKAPKTPVETIEGNLKIDALEVELGAGLIVLVDGKGSGDLLNRIQQIRKKMASEVGVVVPPVRIRDNLQLGSRNYRLRVRGAVVTESELHPDKLLAINPGTARPGLKGMQTKDPAYGLPGVWIAKDQRGRAEAFGYTVVDAPTVLSTHLHELLKTHAADLLTRQDVQNMVDRVKESDPAVVKDIVPNQISLPVLHRVLQALLRERVPVRDLVTILETLGDMAGKAVPMEFLVERTRVALAPAFVRAMEDRQGKLAAIALEPGLESKLMKAIVQSDQGPTLILTPMQVPRFINAIEEKFTEIGKRKKNLVLLCSGNLRPHIWRLLERSLPKLPILSYLEVPRGTQLELLAQIEASVLGEQSGGLFGAPAQSGPQK